MSDPHDLSAAQGDDEPKTPMWLPALGAALFVGAALVWAVTPASKEAAGPDVAAAASASAAAVTTPPPAPSAKPPAPSAPRPMASMKTTDDVRQILQGIQQGGKH